MEIWGWLTVMRAILRLVRSAIDLSERNASRKGDFPTLSFGYWTTREGWNQIGGNCVLQKLHLR
jgi:hypothetical protein